MKRCFIISNSFQTRWIFSHLLDFACILYERQFKLGSSFSTCFPISFPVYQKLILSRQNARGSKHEIVPDFEKKEKERQILQIQHNICMQPWRKNMEYEIFQSKRITLKYDEIYREVFRPYFQLYCSVFNSFILRSLLFTLSGIFSISIHSFQIFFINWQKRISPLWRILPPFFYLLPWTRYSNTSYHFRPSF